ncbi:MAG: glycosyltransferase family 39 protein [Caulobacteraceae bacterium]|nr:glycosyltransferase family 39 protein [Caulobacteraceae bacterium]
MRGRATSAPGGGAPAWLIAFLVVLTCARLVAAAATPLSEDEAYYRLWAGSLQLGYYDHPPMIAWWIRAGMSLAGDNPLGVRLVPTLACGLTGLVIFDLARRLGAEVATAARASVWYNATLTVAMGGSLATPDAAATPFWVLTLWCLARTDTRRGAAWWLGAGVAAGLACLSKYSALFIAPGVLIWLALKPGGIAGLRRPWPWAAALVAAAIFAVNVAWNAQHHWETFDKQFGRIAGHGLKPGFVVELIVGQLLLLNPLIAVFAVRGARPPWRPAEPGRLDATLLLASSLPFAAYLVAHSLHDRVQAHWPVPIYPALAIVAAGAAERVRPGGWLAAMRAAAAPLGLGLAGLVLAHLALPATDVRGLKDPAAAVRGWPAFAQAVDQLRQANGAAWIGSASYGTTSELAAARVGAPVVEVFERDRYPPGDPSWRAALGRPGLIVDLDRRLNAATLARCFADVAPLGELQRGEGASQRQRYAVFRVSRPRRDVLGQGCGDAR